VEKCISDKEFAHNEEIINATFNRMIRSKANLSALTEFAVQVFHIKYYVTPEGESESEEKEEELRKS
jgi:hypothetical protein